MTDERKKDKGPRRVVITIETVNAAFGEDPYTRGNEIGRILHLMAHSFNDHCASRPPIDQNGNTVGSVTWKGRAPC